jgi:hypothetical protein
MQILENKTFKSKSVQLLLIMNLHIFVETIFENICIILYIIYIKI